MALQDNILLYYKFEDSTGTVATDSVGVYNGTASTANIWSVNGKMGRGGDFGVLTDTYNIEYSTSARKISTDVGYSVNFWFKKRSDDRMMAFGKEVDVNNFIQFDFRLDGEWGVAHRVAGTYSVNCDTAGQRTVGSASNDNNWHMATIVWSSTGTVIDLYEDGVNKLNYSGMTSQSFPDIAQRIGTERSNTSGYAWSGFLDEWGVWRRALTAQEVLELYQNGQGKLFPFYKITDNLVSYWKLDEASGNASDSVGANTLTNTGTATYGAGKINNGVDGGNSNSTKSLTSSTSNGGTGSASWSFWMNPNTGFDSGEQCVVGYITVNVINRLEIRLNRGTAGKIYGYRNNGTETTTAGYTVSAGTWYHVALTYNGSQIELFVNGVSIGTAATSGNGSTTTQAATSLLCEVGGTGTKQIYSSTKLDEVGLWSRAISATEVTQIYNAGQANQYPFLIASTKLNNYARIKGANGMKTNIN